MGINDRRYTVVVEMARPSQDPLHTNYPLVLGLVGQHRTMNTVPYRIDTVCVCVTKCMNIHYPKACSLTVYRPHTHTAKHIVLSNSNQL